MTPILPHPRFRAHARRLVNEVCDHHFASRLSLCDAWCAVQRFNARLSFQLPDNELSGLASLAAWACGRRVAA